MPSMFGGSSTDKDYAPHMYVGDDFIHNTGKHVVVGDVHYYAGKMRDEKLAVVRWTADAPTRVPVPETEIPQEVRDAFSPTAFADGERKRADFERLLNNQ